MKIGTIEQSPDGATWVCVGYSSPRRMTSGSVYRYVRKGDGARIRIPSTKLYHCEVSRKNWARWTNVAPAHNEVANGPGAATLENDRARANDILTGGITHAYDRYAKGGV